MCIDEWTKREKEIRGAYKNRTPQIWHHSHKFTLPPRNFFRILGQVGGSLYVKSDTSDAAGRLAVNHSTHARTRFSRAEYNPTPKLSAKLLTLAVCWSAYSSRGTSSKWCDIPRFECIIWSVRLVIIPISPCFHISRRFRCLFHG